MAFHKKLARFGGRSYGLTFGHAILEQLGTTIEEADSKEGVSVKVKVYGDTLIVRLSDKPPLTPAETAYFIMEDFEFAKHFPVKVPEGLEKPPPPAAVAAPESINPPLFIPEKAMWVGELMHRTIEVLRENGPLSRAEFTALTGWDTQKVGRQLRGGVEQKFLTKEGKRFALNPEYFDL